MPKRKRPGYSDPSTRLKADTLEKVQHIQKALQRALKIAKGFERQKLGKRLKAAQAKGSDGILEVVRINKEIEALKILDLGNMAETYLAGKIMKIKRMMESEVLPEEVRLAAGKKGKGSEVSEELKNVMSGMYNLKIVKEAVNEGLRGLYLVMGIPLPTTTNGKKAVPANGILKKSDGDSLKEQKASIYKLEGREGSWSGFESEEEQGEELADMPRNTEQELDLDIDCVSELGDLSRYETRLASSDTTSDEDGESISSSFSDSNNKSITKTKPQSSRSFTLSSSSPSISRSPSPRPTKRSKPTSSSTAPVVPLKQTTFLPTLYGGYFSGSESASDIEDDHPKVPIRKNRPGQMARRAIAEKKFGTGANHIKKGQPRVADMGKAGRENGKGRKDDGWDARKGAKEATGSRFGRDRSDGFRGRGDNAAPQREGGGDLVGRGEWGRGMIQGLCILAGRPQRRRRTRRRRLNLRGKKLFLTEKGALKLQESRNPFHSGLNLKIICRRSQEIMIILKTLFCLSCLVISNIFSSKLLTCTPISRVYLKRHMPCSIADA
ncbi:BUD22-domain-containing protein [Tricladium varicosporioides]|nr:BUD22-domain-containing protein [Hymenoscyphus varicosporioides]